MTSILQLASLRTRMTRHLALVILVVVNLGVGLLVLPGFGESTDELSQHSYAERTIEAVQSLIKTGTWPAFFSEEQPKQGSHGPAFIMTVMLLRNLLLPAGTPVEKLSFSHFLYFVTFQVGVVSLFFLARRWMSDIAAFGTTLMFNTQPLLVGHAFMNPKDVVFMSLVTASAALGLWMVDRSEKSLQAPDRSWSNNIRVFLRQFRCADVWLAGFVLGFASAIRIAAPLIGVVILAYIFLSRKLHIWPRFLAYGVIAVFFMVLFWPYVWPDPFGRFMGSILNSAYYPDVHQTLFNGVLIDSQHIPLSYIPVLIVLQLTETTLLLLLIGAFSMLKKLRWDLIVLILIWFAVPVVGTILMHVNLYNNLRQLFFIFPPLFLVAGLGLDWLLTLFQRSNFRFLVLFLILLPGLYANIKLYPYQYIYYNQLIGGVNGAYRVYELDYWDLAFKEAQSYINQAASPNANIFAGDSKPSAQTFARPDLIFNALGGRKKNWDKYDYIIVGTAGNSDQKFSEFRTVFVVQRDGVPFVCVKKP